MKPYVGYDLVIVEQEIIEQIEDEPHGRTLAWVCGPARQHGKDAPLRMLERMWRAGHVALHDDRGNLIASWQCEAIWRAGDESVPVNVVATGRRSAWRHE